jgi:UDP-GlcNAc:undecaprenyl-phosphate/decaprenyl-phosphate GlcNAc-1-phosphate transferase
MNHASFFALLAFSVATTVMLCLRAKPIGVALDLMDVPAGRKTHGSPTPLLGGVATLIAFVPPALAHVVMHASDRWFSTLLIWLACVALMAFVGLGDDRHSLSPRSRLAISFLVFATAILVDPTFNVRILNFNFPPIAFGLGTWWLAVIFTVICCVGLMNAVNMADGKNGLVLGLSLGWLAILSIRAPESLLPLMGLLAAVLFVLLVFNMRGKLFLGDGGAYAIATAVGLLAIMIYNTPGTQTLRAISADELVLLFIVPVADSFRLTFKRMRQGRSPMSPDRDHLHHLMQDRFGWPAGLLLYWVVALTPGAISLSF